MPAFDVIPQVAIPIQSLLQSQGSQDSKETAGLTNLKQRWYSETKKIDENGVESIDNDDSINVVV